MNEIEHSNWKGFQRFNVVRQRVRAIFHGVLAMNIINLLFLIFSTVVFNYYYFFAGHKSSLLIDEESMSKSVKLEDTDAEITEISEQSQLLDDNEISTGISETEKSEDIPLDDPVDAVVLENNNLVDLKRNSKDGQRLSESAKKLSRSLM